MKTFSMIIKSVLVAGLLTASSVSFAVPISAINGMFGMSGTFNPVNSSGTIVPLNIATGIDFAPNMFRVSSGATDDFAALAGMMGTIKDIQFDPFLGPVVEFWKVGGFSFELSTLDEVTPLGFESTFLNLSGTGIVRSAGFLDTLGSWTFTGLAGGIQFNWLGESDAGGISVPEPMVLALIGIGLIGFGGLRGFYRGQRVPGKS